MALILRYSGEIVLISKKIQVKKKPAHCAGFFIQSLKKKTKLSTNNYLFASAYAAIELRTSCLATSAPSQPLNLTHFPGSRSL